MYQTNVPHTSAATFDPGVTDGLGNDIYSLILELPGNALPLGGIDQMSLVKIGTANFACDWRGPLVPLGGGKGQVLTKRSPDDYDNFWADTAAVLIPSVPQFITAQEIDLDVTIQSRFLIAADPYGLTVTINTHAVSPIDDGAEFHFYQLTTGYITFSAMPGVTIHTLEGTVPQLQIPGSACTVKKISEDTWVIIGLLIEY